MYGLCLLGVLEPLMWQNVKGRQKRDMNWDWIVIIGGILLCVVIMVTCRLPLLCCVIRQIRERLQELNEHRPDRNMYPLTQVAL